ncbi:hypothetical protein ANANG_G00045800 [Anguilla anguilla]|uniref:Uncharacterized protein n=1 Tax=Anguilla anguilla TaxID=7936 RepID=A0A9D3MVZ0_ANGAN|nr:hypothetical protein ANANG_G00045800 [Anguilla anguilla]
MCAHGYHHSQRAHRHIAAQTVGLQREEFGHEEPQTAPSTTSGDVRLSPAAMTTTLSPLSTPPLTRLWTKRSCAAIFIFSAKQKLKAVLHRWFSSAPAMDESINYHKLLLPVCPRPLYPTLLFWLLPLHLSLLTSSNIYLPPLIQFLTPVSVPSALASPPSHGPTVPLCDELSAAWTVPLCDWLPAA